MVRGSGRRHSELMEEIEESDARTMGLDCNIIIVRQAASTDWRLRYTDILHVELRHSSTHLLLLSRRPFLQQQRLRLRLRRLLQPIRAPQQWCRHGHRKEQADCAYSPVSLVLIWDTWPNTWMPKANSV